MVKGKVASTPAKAGMKTGAKQTPANKFFKNTGAVARRASKPAVSGKSGLPSPVTAAGKKVGVAKEQGAAFTNDKGVMSHNAGYTKFIN